MTAATTMTATITMNKTMNKTMNDNRFFYWLMSIREPPGIWGHGNNYYPSACTLPEDWELAENILVPYVVLQNLLLLMHSDNFKNCQKEK